MNCDIYIFGNLKSFSQYPNDYAKKIFQNFYARATATSQMIVHRESVSMYYGYIRKLDNTSKYIGFCVLINGVMFSQIKGLFSIFETAVQKLVEQGNILAFSDTGEVVVLAKKLSDEQQEVERIISFIYTKLSTLENKTKKLPAVKYEIANSEVKSFSIQDNNVDIINATIKYSYTYIYKEQGYNTPSFTRYKEVIKGLNNKIDDITDKYTKLKKKYEKQDKENKISRIIGGLARIIIISLCVIAILFLGVCVVIALSDKTRNELKEAQKNIIQKDENIKDLIGEIATHQDTINDLQNKNLNLQSSLLQVQEERDKAKNELLILQKSPIIIEDVKIGNVYNDGKIQTNYGATLYSSNTMYLKPQITYKGIETGKNIEIKIKLYLPSGVLSTGDSSPYGFSCSSSIDVGCGNNTETLIGWGGDKMGHWGSGTYTMEFWYEDICLKTKKFTIY